MTRMAAASTLGTTLEWFDFIIFSSVAALVFNKLFFPDLSPLMGTVAAFGTFATGFLTRPIGAIIFGHLGDRLGRKTTLIITMMIMGVCTFIVGLLPTYATIGFWAPLLLILVRLVQGLGLGGEWGGAILMCVEHAPRHRRGFYSSFPQVGASLGIGLAAGLVGLANAVSKDDFLTWGWRIPFLLSIVLLGVGLFVRFQILETPAFVEMKQEDAEVKVPIIEVIRSSPRRTLLGLGTRFSESATGNIYAFFVVVYLTQNLGVSNSTALLGTLIASAASIVIIPTAGALTDRYGRRTVYLAGAILTILLAFPIFALLDTRSPALIWLGITLGLAFCWGTMYGAQGVYYSELYPVRIRYSAIGFVYAIGALPSGAIAAAVATSLLAASGGKSWPISVYIIGIAVITVISLLALPETLASRTRQNRGDALESPETALNP